MLKYLTLAVAGQVRAAVRREATAAALFLVGAIVMILAVLFGALAVRDWLSSAWNITLTQADLAVTAGLAVIAVVIAAGVYRRRRRTQSSPLAASAILAAPVAAGALGRRLSVGAVVAVAAVLTGAYLGRQAGRR